MQNKTTSSKLYVFFVIQLLLIIATAWVSIGYYHEDEHFQIIEFLSYKLGFGLADDLPWEYRAQLRPWFQISFYYVIYKMLTFLNINDHFHIMFIFRLISGIVGWFSLLYLTKSIVKWDNISLQFIQNILITLTGFIPIILVRTSGESLAISFFLIGLSIILSKLKLDEKTDDITFSWWRLLLAGICFGMAFEFKFQSAVLTLGFLLWLLFISKRKISEFLIISIGGLLVLVLAAFIDRWGYDEWSFPAWNYFQFNLLSENKNQYGDPHPFFGYLYISIANLALPMVIVYMIAMFFMWFRNKKHVFTWISLLYFVIHCIIENKQLRFLFPLAIMAPFFIIPAFYPLKENAKNYIIKIWNFRKSKFMKFVYFWNILFLIAFSFLHMWSESRIANQRYIYYNFPNGITYINFGEYKKAWDPFYQTESTPGNFFLKYSFYKRKNIKSIRIFNEKELIHYLKENPKDIILCYPLPKINFESPELKNNTELLWSMIPFHENKELLDFLYPAYSFVAKNIRWIEFPGFYKIKNPYK